MRVQNLMNRKYPSLYSDELATKARAILRNRELRVLPVVDKHKHFIGMISRSDIMAITSSVSPIRAKGIMSMPRFIAAEEMDVIQVAREMIRSDEWYAPIVKSSQDYTYLGMLGLENLIDLFLKKGFAKLAKPLSEIMSTEPVTCSPDDDVDNVWRLMQEHSFAGLPVVKKGKLVGIVTQKNLLDSRVVFPMFEAKKGRFKAPSKISSVMRTSVISLKPASLVKEAAELMLEKNIGRVPIIDGKGKLIGVVDREDIVKALL
ncbi:CBS domain-containing protein [Candidatus Bathyarchaeota archaeon]|nr:MAG: CBS domain-containing protein [Candidatus Bathyarchaeota archaeon]